MLSVGQVPNEWHRSNHPGPMLASRMTMTPHPSPDRVPPAAEQGMVVPALVVAAGALVYNLLAANLARVHDLATNQRRQP